ncbi:mitochondrial calcium uniporter protein [Plakobranchus ocellatus]|uniref:Calcium uniporter protein n=1 Tax=Plakobranchus ocellatus TaxID=259542 RepID=A0AAV4BDN7_9GAST|nr:mitochondrial calcium uniporter protein [Plakobranchus ocellatus]
MAAVAPLRKLLSRTLFLGLRTPASSAFDVQILGFTHNRQLAFSIIKPRCLYHRPYCSQVLYQTDVTVDYRDGLPVVSLPLPSRKETCEFTLKPISQTVGDFIRFIKEEDGGIDTVSFSTKDGSRIAKSTTIDVLMRSEFNISINDQKYHVSPPVIFPLSHEDAQTLTDVKLLVSQLYSTLHVENYQLEREQELRKRLEDLNMQIAPMEKQRSQLFVKANDNTNRLAWLGLGLMSLQFGILARLTWWEYSWDIMEPVTYFVTYGTSMAMFAYFVLTKQEYIFPDVKDRQFLIKFHKMASKEKLDVEKYNQLKDAIAEAENDLRRLRDPLQLHLPIKEMEKIIKKE